MADAPNTIAVPRIPYGRADFRGIRLDGSLYVDKTAFVRPLERHNYVLFIRPRRFGKTCWLRTLECYYGRHHREEFGAIFGGTDIGASPTDERGRYLVLWFDFSGMDAAPERMEERFEECCWIDLRRSPEAEQGRLRRGRDAGGWRPLVDQREAAQRVHHRRRA